jgi:hypothetical protein
MSDLPQDIGQSFSDDDLVFGAQMMCEMFYRRTITDEQRKRFIGLYGTPGRLLLDSAKWPASLLMTAQLLVMKVPELRPHFIEQSTTALARSLCISTSSNGALTRIANLMREHPGSFDRLNAHHAAVRRRRLASCVDTKKLLGRNDIGRIRPMSLPRRREAIEIRLKNRSNED